MNPWQCILHFRLHLNKRCDKLFFRRIYAYFHWSEKKNERLKLFVTCHKWLYLRFIVNEIRTIESIGRRFWKRVYSIQMSDHVIYIEGVIFKNLWFCRAIRVAFLYTALCRSFFRKSNFRFSLYTWTVSFISAIKMSGFYHETFMR